MKFVPLRDPSDCDTFRRLKGTGKSKPGSRTGVFETKTTRTKIAGRIIRAQIYENEDWILMRVTRISSKRIKFKHAKGFHVQTFISYPDFMDKMRAIRLFLGNGVYGFEEMTTLTRTERINKMKWARIWVPKSEKACKLPVEGPNFTLTYDP